MDFLKLFLNWIVLKLVEILDVISVYINNIGSFKVFQLADGVQGKIYD